MRSIWGPFEVHLRSFRCWTGVLYFVRGFKFVNLKSWFILRCRLVTCFYLSFTFFFEHFLQGTMDLRHRLITSPQRHLTNSLQTACGHLTIFIFPPTIRRVRRGVSINYGLSTPLQMYRKSSGARFLTGGSNIHTVPIGKKYEGVKIVAYIF